jgi:hypothetical protein
MTTANFNQTVQAAIDDKLARAASELPKNIMCQNCSTLYREDELDAIDDVLERIAPGETMPWGQCPDSECRAVCYPIEHSVDPIERMYKEAFDN